MQGAVTLKLKRLVPEPVRRWRQTLAVLTRAERRALLGVVTASWFRPHRRDWRPAMRGARAVVFVCHGNIIRSPLASAALSREASLRNRPVRVASAGLAARPGEPADPRALESARARGLALDTHRARRLDAEQVESADVIFVMDHVNLARILAAAPRQRDRIFLLGGCQPAGWMTLTEIQDPVSGTVLDVGVAHDQVIAAVRRIAGVWDEPAP